MILGRHSYVVVALVGLSAVGWAADPIPVMPAEGLRPVLAKVADRVAAHAKEKKIEKVNAVTPEGPADPLANAAPDGVLKVLKEELSRAGVPTSDDVTTKLKVTYKDTAVGPDRQLSQLKVVAEVQDANDDDRGLREVFTLTDKLLLARLGGQLSGPLDLPLNDVARQVAEQVDKLGGKPEVEVQSVQGPKGENRGVWDMLTKALARQTTARGPLKVTLGAEVQLRVKYKLAGTTPADLQYAIEFELLDGRGEAVGVKVEAKKVPVKSDEKTRDESGLRTLSLAAPVPLATPPGETDEQWLQRYIDALGKDRKPMAIVGNEVRLSKESEYGVEVWVGGKAVTPTDVNGQAVVQFDEGAEYQLVVWNRKKGYHAAVGVRIDGLSMFVLQKTPGEDHFAIADKGGLIPGWYERNDKHYAFRVGTDDTSPVASRLPNKTDTGTIAVTFAPAWKEGQPPPVKGTRAGTGRAGLMGTQVGGEGKSEYTDERLYHAEVQETVVIRYAPKKK